LFVFGLYGVLYVGGGNRVVEVLVYLSVILFFVYRVGRFVFAK